jgi:glutamate N-acetyltransferase/amino-acid N-acetyltransferase
VVVNSGCANAVTGTKGREDAFAMAEAVDKCFEKNDVKHGTRTLVMSTGVIGQQLPISKITNAIPKAHASLGSSHEDWMRAAQAICTTDTFPKLITRTFTLPSHPDTEYSIAGMTKGAGMIHPNMGTLLAIVCTDAKVEPTGMRDLLRSGTKFSFNRITIDGDTSTNDTVAFLANGAAAPAETAAITFPKPDANHPAYQDSQVFVRVFKDFMLDLAKLVVRDGEGATKFVTVRVQSDISQAVCRAVAYSIAKSSLVKTALYGKDANWGRILCAIGYTPYMTGDPHLRPANMRPPNDKRQTGGVDLQRTTVMFIPSDGSEPLMLLSRGEPEDVDESRAKEILEMEDLEIFVKLDDDGTHPPYEMPGHGQSPIRRWKTEESVIYTCDLSHEYVTINGDYRT